jgi:DNA modification methylase
MTAQKEGARKTAAQPASVKVAAAKGRPMLSWVGKRPLREVRAYPAQPVERFSADGSVSDAVDWSDWPDRYDRGGLLFHGDNKEVLAHLLSAGFRGKVDLVYIDPPFDSGADYVRRVQLRGASGSARLDGETYTLGEQIQYTDIWANDTYLQFMYERLLLLKELLSVRGVVVLHADHRKVHQLRLVMDEVFGPERFENEIHWYFYNKMHDDRKEILPRATNTLIAFSRSDRSTFNRLEVPRSKAIQQLKRVKVNGVLVNLKDEEGNLVYQERETKTLDNVWPIPLIPPADQKQVTGYPTQKPAALLELVTLLWSSSGDIVLDCFIGSGTTAAVAQKLGRRWIGADINKGAIQTTVKRLAGVMEEQASASASQQQKAFEETDDGGAPPLPAQLAFTTWRVNDYDLAIQHNEAVNLACEHLGVERTKADPFFDGTLGTELVKIVPFNHPVAPPDLEAVVAELDARPGEERNVVLVALGMEVGCAKWLDDYNRGRPINKLRVVELRSDPKYGRFFEHQPASARVRLDGSTVIIDDFISPSILERLSHTDGVLSPQVTDWRSMVDSVMIDTEYDGETFNVIVADIPERKTDLVAGSYELELPKDSEAPVAVKITDMLGEEVLAILER